jgi:hypothetical protein
LRVALRRKLIARATTPYNLPEASMAKKVLKFPEENTARLRLMAHFAEDRNECVGDDVIRAIAKKPPKNPSAKKQNQK